MGMWLSLSFVDSPLAAAEGLELSSARRTLPTAVIGIEPSATVVESNPAVATTIDTSISDTPSAPLTKTSANPLSPALHGPQTGRAAPTIRINEIRRDQTGTDNDEYFELAGPAGASLSALTYLVIGDDPSGVTGSGWIEEVTPLTGSSLAGTGFFVAAEGTFTMGLANMTTDLNFENTDNVTHMLVTDFTGTDAMDLDTDNDGVLDVTPWTSVNDSIAIVGPGAGDLVYSARKVGPEGAFHPGHVFLCTPKQNWIWGQFDPIGGDDSPGTANGACVSSPNGGLTTDPASATT
jgi:hypothetical protein